MWKVLANASSYIIKTDHGILNIYYDFIYVVIKMLCIKKSRENF